MLRRVKGTGRLVPDIQFKCYKRLSIIIIDRKIGPEKEKDQHEITASIREDLSPYFESCVLSTV